MFAGKKSAQIREILISESAWEEMTCLFAPSLNETDLTQIPKVIEYCKKNPQKNLYTFKNQASNDLPN
ncbi:acid-resistance protein [Escherichia coli]|nr:acid-resistance protein [Escherichia coli]